MFDAFTVDELGAVLGGYLGAGGLLGLLVALLASVVQAADQ